MLQTRKTYILSSLSSAYMINVAIVGYKFRPKSSDKGEIITWFPGWEDRFDNIHYCHVDIVEDRAGKTIGELVDEMLGTKPNVLHYANYRDTYNQGSLDQEYMQEVQRKSALPILLTSALPEAKALAERLGIAHMFVPLDIDEYQSKLHELARGNK